MPNVLCTGSAGYIGSHICKALLAAGYTPVTFDNLSTGHRSLVKFGPLVVGDILDTPKLVSVMRNFRPVGVVHLAGKAYVGESVRVPALYYRNNVAGSLSVAEAMLETGYRNLVFSSSCAIYGPQDGKITENMPKHPISPYGASKLITERLYADFDAAYNFPHVNLRYFNAAGSGGDIGEIHVPETHLIPLAIEAANSGGILNIFGNDFDTPDGTAVRDFVHISDLASAHLLALDWLLAGKPSDSFNLGTGKGHSVSELCRVVAVATGKQVRTAHLPRRAGDAPYLVCNPAKALKCLGWQAEYGLKEMVESAVKWHSRPL